MNKLGLLSSVVFAFFLTPSVQAQQTNTNPVVVKDVEQKKFLDIQVVKSKSGVEAWLVEDHSLPIISLDMGFIGSGSVNDPMNKQGLSRLVSNTMDEGAGKYDSQAFQKRLSDKSISLYFSSGRDNFSVSLKTLSKNKDLAFELLDVALNEPRFDEEPVERMRQANLSRIKSSLSKPDWLAARLMNDRIYGSDVYGQNSGGSLTSMAAITIEDLKEFTKNQIGKNRVKLSVVGDITAKELSQRIDEVFADMPEVNPAHKTEDVALDLTKNYIHEMDIPQSSVIIVGQGIDRFDPDYQAAKVTNFILGGGGFGSRLTEEAREEKGLTYGIYSSLSSLDRVDLFTISTSTKNETVDEMLKVIEGQISSIIENGVSEEELNNAKSYLIGSLPLSLSSTDKISSLMLSLQLSGREIDYLEDREQKIKAVTVADIKRVAQRILSQPRSSFIVGRPDDMDGTFEYVTDIPNAE